jgi:RimJ/RimL family protein N-acetyltransferase
MITPYRIENDRIGLASTRLIDLDFIIQMESEPQNKKYILPYDKARHQEAIESKDEEHWSVWDKEKKELVGFVILAGHENPHHSLEFKRIVIHKKGNGFGRQCVRLIKEYCFKELHFHRLWLDAFDDNAIAIALYLSEGFQIEGRIRDVVKEEHRYRTLVILSLLEEEGDLVIANT